MFHSIIVYSNIVNRIILFFSILLVLGCDSDNNEILEDSENLIGYWVDPVYDNSTITFIKANEFEDDNYGIVFKPNHKFAERKNSGWCGTPPISYAIYDGNWKKDGDLLNINVGYWGGKIERQWKIMSISDKKLIISVLKEDYREER